MKKSKIFARTKRKIEGLERSLSVLDTLPPTVVELAFDGFATSTGEFYLEIPFDPELYRDIRHCLLDNEWEYAGRTKYDSGKSLSHFENEKKYVGLWMNPYEKGSRCQLEKTGENVTPIYKVVCK